MALGQTIQVYDARYDPRLVRKFEIARSYSEPRSVSLSEEEPEAYVEWGAPSNFEVDPLDETDRGEKPYRLEGHYYEEGREWEDIEVFPHSQYTQVLGRVFVRVVKAIAFRGRFGEQVIMRFNNPRPVFYRDKLEFNKGDTIPTAMPPSSPFQAFAWSIHSRSLNVGNH